MAALKISGRQNASGEEKVSHVRVVVHMSPVGGAGNQQDHPAQERVCWMKKHLPVFGRSFVDGNVGLLESLETARVEHPTATFNLMWSESPPLRVR